jgi:hypothetical protein
MKTAESVLLAVAFTTGFVYPGLLRAGPAEPKVVTLGGLKSQAPKDWVEEKPTSRFRVEQFKLPAAPDDKNPADLIITYFGANGAGSNDENVKRWKGQFVPPDGKTIDDVTKVEKMKVAGVDVLYVDIYGTYKFKERPFDPNAETMLKPNYRMLNAILESKDGPYYIRLVGPAKVVEHHKKGFDEWLKAFK